MADDNPSWHPIALSRDVPAGVTRAVILSGAEIVLWRGEDGAIHAWDDRCPHRGMRLSYGFVRENALNCLYHGWQYEGSSRCIRIPAHPDLEVPKTIKATAYAALERSGLVWMTQAPPGSEPASIAGPVTPLVSTAADVPLRVLREKLSASSADGLVFTEGDLLIAAHPVSAAKCMLHGLLPGEADAARVREGVLAVRTLRRSLESIAEAA